MSTGATRVALVPGALALLPEYASLSDPLAVLRKACLDAVAWLGEPVTVLADPQGERIGRALLAAVGRDPEVATRAAPDGGAYLVVGNGSARRTEKAPGYLDARAAGFDVRLGAALRGGELDGVDLGEADALWARLGAIPELAGLLDGTEALVDFDDDPYGVQYWVMRWELRG